MNPLAYPKCAGRLLMALAAVSAIVFSAGCGSSSSTQPNQGGFTNGSLSGTYVFSTTGTDTAGDILTTAGAFVANGSGGVSGGTMDVIDSGVAPASPVAQTITSGSYNVGTDGRGQVQLTSSVGTFTYDFVLTSGNGTVSSHGQFIEFDGNGTGSGTLDLQTALTGISQLAGSYAFSFNGIDNGGDPFATVGSFTLGNNGTTTAGVEDFNAGGIVYENETLSGIATLGTGTAPGAMSLSTAPFGLTYDFYPIDATHLKFIETDYTEILTGDAYTQTGAVIPDGPMVFTMEGGTSTTGPIALGGLMTSDGSGNFPTGLEDINENGSLSPAQISFSGSLVLAGTVGNRTVVNLSGFTPAIQWTVYPTASAGLLMLETDAETVMSGVGYGQSATSFASGTSSSAVGYGLNLTGINIAGINGDFEIDDIAQFNATSPSSTPNMTGVLDENDQGVTVSGNLSGTYTPDSPATGRGSILVPSLPTPLGGLSLEYYVIDGSNMLVIEGDTAQVSAGSFELQTTPTGAVASLHHSVVAQLKPKAQAAWKEHNKKPKK